MNMQGRNIPRYHPASCHWQALYPLNAQTRPDLPMEKDHSPSVRRLRWEIRRLLSRPNPVLRIWQKSFEPKEAFSRWLPLSDGK